MADSTASTDAGGSSGRAAPAREPSVVVCVAPADLRPEVDELTATVRADPRRSDLNPSDATAVEYGLLAAEAWGMALLVVAAGPPEIEPVLVEIAAFGAAVLRIDGDASRSGDRPGSGDRAVPGPQEISGADLAGDPAAVAATLAEVISARVRPALVLCGDRSAGPGVGAVPALLAERLGLAQALGVVSIEVQGGSRLTVERRLDGGWRETLVVDRPAVVSVEGTGARLSRAGLEQVLSAASAGVEVIPAPTADAPQSRWAITYGRPRPYRPRTRTIPAPRGDARGRLLELTRALAAGDLAAGDLAAGEPARVLGPLPPAEAAVELLSYLGRDLGSTGSGWPHPG